VVPANGALITSWSTLADSTGGEMLTMKVFRKAADPNIYKAVGHDGPRALTPGVLNTFPVNLQVQAGDVLGLDTANGSSAPNYCAYSLPGEQYLISADLADGAAGGFAAQTGLALNISATVALQPSNTFSFGKLKRNTGNGTATLTVDVPGPGTLSLKGTGVKKQRSGGATLSRTVTEAGSQTLRIRAKGAKKRKLKSVGKVKVKVAVTYTPSGDLPGQPNVLNKRVKLVDQG
jgi:hypothetical protein